MTDDGNNFRIGGRQAIPAVVGKGIDISGLDPKVAAKAEKASTDFEALLLQQMMAAMWETVPKGEMISNSNEEGMYRDMLNEAVAKEVAKGQGIGIKEVIYEDIIRQEQRGRTRRSG